MRTTNSASRSQIDDPSEPKRKRLKRTFKIWEDPVSDREAERDEHTMHGFTKLQQNNGESTQPTIFSPWTPVNSSFPVHTLPVSQDNDMANEEDFTRPHGKEWTADLPIRGTFSISEEEKYPKAHAGVPTGPKQKYVYKKGITFLTPAMEDLGLIGPQPTIPETSSQKLDKDASTASRDKRPAPLKLPRRQSTAARDTSPEHPTIDFDDWLRGYSSSPIFGTSPTQSTTLKGINRRAVPSPIFTGAAQTAKRSKSHPSTPTNPKKATGKKRISLSPISAKPQPSADQTIPLPSLFSPQQQRIPRPTQLICSCHKPAETFDVKIVECYNPGCNVGWYHYNCLAKTQKLSALHGRWTCDLCKVEKDWGYAAKATDFKCPFSEQELADALGGPGGIEGVANPYGLGNITKLSGEVVPRAVRAFGWACDPEAVARAVEEMEDYDAHISMLEEDGVDVASDAGSQDYGTELSYNGETGEYVNERVGEPMELDDVSEDLGTGSGDVTSSSEDYLMGSD